MSDYTINQKVILRTFNGTRQPAMPCEPQDNYWLLIGKHGTVVLPKNERDRYLVQFEVNVNELGLHCHNEVENALFILETDLSLEV